MWLISHLMAAHWQHTYWIIVISMANFVFFLCCCLWIQVCLHVVHLKQSINQSIPWMLMSLFGENYRKMSLQIVPCMYLVNFLGANPPEHPLFKLWLKLDLNCFQFANYLFKTMLKCMYSRIPLLSKKEDEKIHMDILNLCFIIT